MLKTVRTVTLASEMSIRVVHTCGTLAWKSVLRTCEVRFALSLVVFVVNLVIIVLTSVRFLVTCNLVTKQGIVAGSSSRARCRYGSV